jgi:hypothetical protein
MPHLRVCNAGKINRHDEKGPAGPFAPSSLKDQQFVEIFLPIAIVIEVIECFIVLGENGVIVHRCPSKLRPAVLKFFPNKRIGEEGLLRFVLAALNSKQCFALSVTGDSRLEYQKGFSCLQSL